MVFDFDIFWGWLGECESGYIYRVLVVLKLFNFFVWLKYGNLNWVGMWFFGLLVVDVVVVLLRGNLVDRGKGWGEDFGGWWSLLGVFLCVWMLWVVFGLGLFFIWCCRWRVWGDIILIGFWKNWFFLCYYIFYVCLDILGFVKRRVRWVWVSLG